MLKFGKESATPDTGDSHDSGKGGSKNLWCVLTLGVLVIIALVLRIAFAYSISADAGYALSGGSIAQYHLNVVENILNGTYAIGVNGTVNYPAGGLNVYPPLGDFLAAAVGALFSGMGTATAAAAGLAWISPIFGALTIIPVYLVGKELYSQKIGIVSALVFTFLALPINASVFSNGNSLALAAFLLAFMVLFMVKMEKAMDNGESTFKYAILAGLFFGLMALTINSFRGVLVAVVIMMVVGLLMDRYKGIDVTATLMSYTVVILVGIVIAAVYYLPAGLFDAVFSGPLLIAVISIALAFVFKFTQSKPWIVMVPALVVVFVIIAAILYLAAPALGEALIFGNSVYATELMKDLSLNSVSMSGMAANYGWLTLWLPICLGIYELYVYARKDRSALQLFKSFGMIALWCVLWMENSTAVAGAVIIAVGSAAVIVKVLERADLKTYWTSIKSAGFPGCFKKIIKPLPFVSVLAVAFLIIVPNVSYAVDAGIPDNDDSQYYFTGNTHYVIKTGDKYPVGEVWNYLDAEGADGSMVAWFDYSYDIPSHTGVMSVTDLFGNGVSPASQVLLSEGSAGAVAASMVRILMTNDVNYSGVFGNNITFEKVRKYIADPSLAVKAIAEDAKAYGDIKIDLTDENAVYYASIKCLTDSYNAYQLMQFYEILANTQGEIINYVLVDGSMLPLQYGDNSYFSTLAYFADCKLDGYGAATKYFSYPYISWYQYSPSYAVQTQYTDAMYQTFLWRALVGQSASDAGYTSSYEYLVSLALANKDVKVQPGAGLAGYDVVFWNVQYNEDDKALVGDDGWEYMNAYDAIAKQKLQGGVINYLSSIVLLEYKGLGGASLGAQETISGSVVDADGAGVNGVTVSVYTYSPVTDVYTIYSVAKTIGGKYTALVPGQEYTVEFSKDGVVLASFGSGAVPAEYKVPSVQLDGYLKYGSGYRIILTGGDEKYTIDAIGKDITNLGLVGDGPILPGQYTYTIMDETAKSIGSGSLTLLPGNNVFAISPTTYTITVTVKDIYGLSVESGVVYAYNVDTAEKFSADIEDGKAVITVVPGYYSIEFDKNHVAIGNSTLDVRSANKSATVTMYDAIYLSGLSTGFMLDAITFSKQYYDVASVPVGLMSEGMSYSLYKLDGDYATLVAYDEGGVSSIYGPVCKITGKMSKAGWIIFEEQTTGATVRFATASDGSFAVLLPKSTYSFFGTDGSGKAYCGQFTKYNEDTDMGEIELGDSRVLTVTVRYESQTSSGNVNMPFVGVEFEYEVDGMKWNFVRMTGTDGKAKAYVPDGVEVKMSINGGSVDNDAFLCKNLAYTFDASTSDQSHTFTIKVGDEENAVKDVTVKAPYDMTVKPSTFKGDEITMKAGETKTLQVGTYDVKLDASKGYYYDGEAKLYPGLIGFFGIEPIAVDKVTIVSGEEDLVLIDGGGKYYSDGNDYFFQKGEEYLVKSFHDGKLAYASIPATHRPATIDVTAEAEEMTISGNVGIIADGDLTVKYDDVVINVEVKSGTFTVDLPSDVTTAEFDVEIVKADGGYDYTYKVSKKVSGLVNGACVNLAVTTADVGYTETENLAVKVSGVSLGDGAITVSLSIENKTDSVKSYTVKPGVAWVCTKAYLIEVPAGKTVVTTVTGEYDMTKTIGDDTFTVTVVDLTGTETATVKFTEGKESGKAELYYHLGEIRGFFKDKISSSEYIYALNVSNEGTAAGTVKVDVKPIAGWTITLMDEKGLIIVPNGGSITVPGLSDSVVYIKLANDDGKSETIPSISGTVDGNSFTFAPKDVKVTAEEYNASGTNIVNERSPMPAGIWFLLAVVLLMIVGIFLIASKRGVLSRK